MPRFHFHVQDGQYFPDIDGTDLEDVSAARREAVRLAGRLLDDNPGHFWDSGEWRMLVSDEAGVTLFVLTFSAEDGEGAAVKPTPQ